MALKPQHDIITVPVSSRLASLFGLRWLLGRYGFDPCDEWDPNAFLGLPDGLFWRAGNVMYCCASCGEATELPVDPEEYEDGHPHNVCGRSPRCCP